MAIVKPSQLRYAQCDLPGDVEAAIDAFIDEFYFDMRQIELELDEYNATTVPGMLEAIQEQVEFRKELLDGAPIPELSSLPALQDNLMLPNPELKEDDPALVSLDERKLGAGGMVLIHGKMFKKLSGTDFEAFRQIWNAVGGEYEAFLALGDGIADSNDGDFTCVQWLPDSDKFPYINQSWSKLASYNKFLNISKYKQAVLWKESINNSTSNYNKLKAIGFEDQRISLMFANQQPTETKQVAFGFFQGAVGELKSLAQLLLLPFTDPRRQPKWKNEVDTLEKVVNNYLKFRTEFNLTSYIFKADLWERAKAMLTKEDFQELFEHRPEVTNMMLPTDEVTLGDMLNEMAKLPLETSVINAYLISLPRPNLDLQFEGELLSTGSKLLITLHREAHPSETFVQQLLEKVKGEFVSNVDAGPPKKINKNEMKDLLGDGKPPNKTIDEYADKPTEPGGSLGQVADSVSAGLKQAPDPDLAETAMGASSVGDKAIKTGTQAPTGGGLPTVENYMTNLFRRVKFTQNFTSCEKSVKSTSSQPADDQAAQYEAQAAAAKKVAKGEKLTAKEKADLAAAIITKNPGASADSFTKYGPSMQKRITGSNKTAEQKAQEREQLSAIKKVLNNQSLNTTEINYIKQYLITHKNSVLEAVVKGENVSGTERARLSSTVAALEKEVNKTQRDPDPSAEVNKIAEQLKDFKSNSNTANSDDLKRLPLRAQDRNRLERDQGNNRTKVGRKFEYKCSPKFENDFTRHLAEMEKKLRQQIIRICEALKRAVFLVQDIVDQLIIKIQVVLDQVLGALERLLTLDLNLGGAIGFDSSLIKCSWALDLGLKLDLFGELLKLLNEFFKDFGQQFRDGLKFIQDAITKAICVPVRLLESFLGGVNALLNLIGCSLKDIKLPTEILDLLKALLFTFDLRSLILKKGYDAYLEMTLNFQKNKNRFKGLTQFASLCQKISMKKVLDDIDGVLLLAVTSPQTGADAIGNAADVLKKAAIRETTGNLLG